MPTKLKASSVINWQSDSNDRPYKVDISPESLNIGSAFTVTIYAAEQYALYSPYAGITSGKQILPDIKTLDESLSASNDKVSAAYPIALLNSAKAQTPVVDTVSRVIVYPQDSNLGGFVAVIADALKLTAIVDSVGSIGVNYNTYHGQQWQHAAFTAAGNYVLFAQNQTTGKWVEIPLSVAEISGSAAGSGFNLEIVAVNAPSSFGWGGVYNRLNVLPMKANAKVFTNIGRLEKKGNFLHKIEAEKITLDGSGTIKTKFPVHLVIDHIGIFYDAKNNQTTITPYPNADGLLQCTKNVFGEISIAYQAWAEQYDYYPETDGTLLTGGVDIKVGSVMAVSGKETAIFQVQKPNVVIAQKQEVLTVYFEKAVNELGEWELPPSIKNNPPVASYPAHSFAASSLMKTWNFVTAKVPVETVFYDGSFFSSEENVYSAEVSLKPFLGTQTNTNRVYHIEKKNPEGFTQSQIAEISKAEIELKKKWKIPS